MSCELLSNFVFLTNCKQLVRSGIDKVGKDDSLAGLGAAVYRVHQGVGPGGERAVRAGSSGEAERAAQRFLPCSAIEAALAEVVAEAALGYYPGLSRQGLVAQPYQPAHRLPSLFFYVSCYGHVKKKLRLLIILFNFVILRIKL